MRASSILNSALLAGAKRAGTPLSGGFAPYEVDEDEVIPAPVREAGVSAPEPIKVTKVKKKKVHYILHQLISCLIKIEEYEVKVRQGRARDMNATSSE